MKTELQISNSGWQNGNGPLNMNAEVETGTEIGLRSGLTHITVYPQHGGPEPAEGWGSYAVEVRTKDIPTLIAVLAAHHAVWEQRGGSY